MDFSNPLPAESASIPTMGKEALHAILDQLQAGVVVHGWNSEIVYANARACFLLGWDSKEVLGVGSHNDRWRFVNQDGSPMNVAEYPVSRALAGERVDELVLGILRPGRTEITWVMCNGSLTIAEARAENIAVVTFTDITELTRASRALRLSEERLRLILQSGNDAPWDRNLESDENFQSVRMWEILGEKEQPPEGATDPFWELLHPDDRGRVLSEYEAALNGTDTSFILEFRLRHKAGHYVPILSKGFVSRDSSGKAVRVSGINSDLTERKRSEEQIYRLAYFDPLTGLPNRTLLIEQLRHALVEGARSGHFGALLFIDLDNFKDLNDTLGHDLGDELLKRVAERLRATVREVDVIARLGGDEFVVVLQHLSSERDDSAFFAEHVAKTILACLRSPYDLAGQQRSSTASVGIALFDSASEGVEVLLKQADLAMYNAKESGRDTLRFFDTTMQQSVNERHATENSLRLSIERNEMSVYYQAQVAETGRVIGAEALLRWHRNDHFVAPDHFIPIAESTGMIVWLGMWTLQIACEQLAEWSQDADLSALSISVNVSVRQFRDATFVENVIRTVNESRADPAKLRLEITESLFARDIATIVEKMAQLRRVGISFSLDDFGVGYSSLRYLQNMPLQEIKIDRAFVAMTENSRDRGTIAALIVTLSKQLELEVVAEGVETPTQFEALRALGCDTFQGYLFSAACSIDEFERLVFSFNAQD